MSRKKEKKIIEELTGPTVVKRLVGNRIEELAEEGWEGKAWPVRAKYDHNGHESTWGRLISQPQDLRNVVCLFLVLWLQRPCLWVTR